MAKTEIPKAGQLIEITARKVGDKVQPHIRQGGRYAVAAAEKGPAGKVTVLVSATGQKGKKGKTWRVTEGRFSWRAVDINEIREEDFMRQCAKDAVDLATQFSRKEQADITLLPLIINRVAWVYAFKALEKGAQYRVQVLKKLSRSIRELHREYRHQLERDLRALNVDDIERQTDRFMDTYSRDFTIFYFTVNREFKKKMPDYPYDDLRTYAIMSVIFIDYASAHNARMDALICRKLGQRANTIENPVMTKLRRCIEAMAGENGKFDYREYNVGLCRKIFGKNLKEIDFNFM